MNNSFLEQMIAALEQEVHDDISDKTLEELSTLLNVTVCDSRIYKLASLGVINSIKNPNQHKASTWYKEIRLICYQKLLDQDNCTSEVHIFLSSIAAAQSYGQYWVIPAIAKEFEIVLRPHYERKSLTKNAILCLMLVREFLGDWITQDEISNLHINTYPVFSKGDLSLPYNSLFDSSVYYRNINDLKQFVLHPEKTTNLKLIHLVLLGWLYGKDTLYPYSELNLINIVKEKISQIPASEYEIEICSAKTLLLHHACELKELDDTKLQELIKVIDCTKDFSNVLDLIAKNQAHIRSNLNGNELSKSAQNLFKKTYQGLAVFKKSIERLTGISLTSQKKLKIAICISGQFRGYEKAFESWKKSILVGVDYDIYVHSWKDIGGTNADPVRKFLPFDSQSFNEAYREYCIVHGYENIKKEYPTLFEFLKNSAQVTEPEVMLFYGAKNVVLEDESDVKFDGYTNSDKMHYKIAACHQMMKSSNINYDLAIRIRPDFSVSFTAFNWVDILNFCKTEPVIFADSPLGTQYMTCMMGDQFAISTPDILDIYANAWDIYPKISNQKILGCNKNFQGHASIAITCWIHKVKILKLPIKQGGLLNSKVMPKKMIANAISIDSYGRNSIWDHKFSASLR